MGLAYALPSSPTVMLIAMVAGCFMFVTVLQAHHTFNNLTDESSLYEFKREADPYGVLTTWNASVPLCDWRGITCDQKRERVVKLELQGLGLVGSFSPHIGNLSSLIALDLRNNIFVGKISEEIGRLSRLKKLYLGNNKITKIPANITGCSLLEILDLSSNNINNESLPLELTRLLYLQELYLFNNHFIGSIPPSFGNLSSLISLVLDDNALQGYIPAELGKLMKLERLLLNENNLSGRIPSSVYNISSLVFLFAIHNKLVGSIPPYVGNLVNLKYLVLSSNNMGGNIPAEIGQLQQLKWLDLSDNYFSGKIPLSLGNCSSLANIDLSKNKINGIIPARIFTLPLIYIGLSDNKLSGNIPKCISNTFIEIYMARSSLNGSIPSSLGKLGQLQRLDLSMNNLRGQIPVTFKNLTTIVELNLSNNHLSGEFVENLKYLWNLGLLDLSRNELEGEVPDDGIFKVFSANDLRLKGNKNLCGGTSIMKLPACPKPSQTQAAHGKHSHKAMKIAILAVSVSILMILLCTTLIMFQRKRLRNGIAPNSPPSAQIKREYIQISYAELSYATNGFNMDNLIGFGSSGSVFKGILYDGAIVAIKVLHLKRRRDLKSFVAECRALSGIRHRNLVKLITYCSNLQGNEFKALIFEFMPNGSMDKWLHPPTHLVSKSGNPHFNLNLLQRLNIAIDVASAMDYLHHDCPTPIVHCDLKPSNILLDENMKGHVGDFGLARILSSTNLLEYKSSTLGLKGSIGYIPPEYGFGVKASTKGDVYSFGILLLEMFTGKRPTNDMFLDGLTLREFVRNSYPDRVMEVADKRLLEEGGTNRGWEWKDEMQSSLAAIMGIGLSCSMESAKGRSNMRDVLKNLQDTRNSILNLHSRREMEAPCDLSSSSGPTALISHHC